MVASGVLLFVAGLIAGVFSGSWMSLVTARNADVVDKQAIRHYEPLVEVKKPVDPVKVGVEAAVAAFKAGDNAEAARLLEKIDLAKANSAPAWELSGMLKEASGDKPGAMDCYSRGIAAAPSEGLFYRRAVLYRTQGMLESALADLTSATSRPPVHMLLSNERLLLLIQMGREDQVRREIDDGILHSSSPDGWCFALAALALEAGNYPEGARLLALAKQSVPPGVFQQVLLSPVFIRYQSEPAVMRFYFGNTSP